MHPLPPSAAILPIALVVWALARVRRAVPVELALACALLGLTAGCWRLTAIDAGAFTGPVGQRVAVTGVATSPARGSLASGRDRIDLATAAGRLQLETAKPVAGIRIGRELAAVGVVEEPSRWLVRSLRRAGIGRVLVAERVRLTGRRRGGPRGAIDRLRERAEAAIDRGMPARQSALVRGMVLGQDEAIDAATVDSFRRSGLAHLLAVSGQNVMLLALLAGLVLALAGLGPRARLLGVLALIAIYVPLTGAGPSIQRAAVMGAAGVIATLTGRRRSGTYALLLAASATLMANPRATGDPGWQLSFAAVVGILLWSRGIREALVRWLGGGAWQRSLADGVAMTCAATLATAPLMAHLFDTVSVAALPANLLALPAVAPVMWLGMLAAAAGQVPALPVEALNAVNAPCVAMIAQVADWLAAPEWALVPVHLNGTGRLVAAYAAMLGAWWLLASAARRRRGLRLSMKGRAAAAVGAGDGGPPPAVRPAGPARRGTPSPAVRGAWVLLALLGMTAVLSGSGVARSPNPGLTVTFLDVGQGDAILLQPADGGAVLVDGGPPGAGLGRKLRRLGIRRLAAAIVTHPQADHSGGVQELLGAMPVGAVIHADAGGSLARRAAAARVRHEAVSAGDVIGSGSLRLQVMWPGPATGPAGDDPNRRSLVLVAEWRGFEALLTGDAEAEAVDIRPGPVDVLKVAHHGSRDAGLPALLASARPRLAVISVGARNPHGHPAPETLAALRARGVPVRRTDRDGTITLRLAARGWGVATSD